MNQQNYTLDEMLAYAFPDEKERQSIKKESCFQLARRIKDLTSLLNMKNIEIGLLRRDVSRLRAVICKRANMN